MLNRTGSPLAIVNALALTCATLLTGAWDASNHGHDVVETNTTHCTVDHDAEATVAPSHATVTTAARVHDNFCIACQLGCATTSQIGQAPDAKPLDLPSAAPRPDSAGRFESDERRPRTARGPPTG